MTSLAARLTGEKHSYQALKNAAATLIASRLLKKVKVDLFEQPLIFSLNFLLYNLDKKLKKVVMIMPKFIKVNPYAIDTQLVGIIPESIIDYYSIECSNLNVYMPPGVLKHLKKRRHWNDFVKYHQYIPNMIANPDFAGQNPNKPNTIELYKVIDAHILLPVKLNIVTGLFLSSFYRLDNGANLILKRLRNGRIHPFTFFNQ